MWRDKATRFIAKHSPLFILAALFITFALISPSFRGPGNIENVAKRTVIIGVISMGQLLVILSAGIDLSVGSVAALAGVCGCLFMTGGLFQRVGDMAAAIGAAVQSLAGPFHAIGGAIAAIKTPLDALDGLLLSLPPGVLVYLGVLFGVGIGLVCGCINGFFVTRGRIPPFIATLGMMMAARGGALLITEGQTVSSLPKPFEWLGGSRMLEGGASAWFVPVGILAAVTLVTATVLFMTRFGRYLYAVGGNREAARLSGVPVDQVRMRAFAISGLLAGLGGMILASRTSIGSPNGAEMYELDAIAACVLGGASLMGGEGSAIATLAGALTIAVLNNFSTIQGWDTNWQKVIVGGLVILLVFYDTMRKRRAGLLKD